MAEDVVKRFFDLFKKRYCIDLNLIRKRHWEANFNFRYFCNNSQRWSFIPYYDDLISNGGLLGFKGQIKSYVSKRVFRGCGINYEGYSGAIDNARRIVISSQKIEIPKDFYYYAFGKYSLAPISQYFPSAVSLYVSEGFNTSFLQNFKLLYYDWGDGCWKEISTEGAYCFLYDDFYFDLLSGDWWVKLGFYAYDKDRRRYEGGILLEFTKLEDVLLNDALLDRIANKVGLNLPKELLKISKILGG